ncbi:MAG: PEGA domain-containing protein [Myxococcaceae bacterium]|nr:PEGA domain-containing protein [Myxococcaceae bacterium]
MTLVLAVLLFAAPPSSFEQGQKAFAEGKFDVALKALDQAAAEARDAATLEKIHLMRGQAFAARQSYAKAEEAFALALEANPEATLDPGKVDPSVVKLLESNRARTSGSVSVQTAPAGATVFLDGADAGTAPVTLTAGIGRHKVAAQWAEGQRAELGVLVRSKRETFVELVLQEHEKVVERVVEKVVEKRVEVPVAQEPPPVEDRFVRPYAAVRGAVDLNAGPEGGLDLGAGVDFKHVSVGVYVRPYRYFYVIPRAAALWPIFDFLTLFGEGELDIRATSRFGLAVGLNVGVEWLPKKWFGAFVSAGGKGFIINQGFVVDWRVTLAGGLRARLP